MCVYAIRMSIFSMWGIEWEKLEDVMIQSICAEIGKPFNIFKKAKALIGVVPVIIVPYQKPEEKFGKCQTGG